MRRMNTQGALEGEPLCVDVGNLLSIDSIEPDAPAGNRRAMRVMNGVDGQVRACRCGVSKIMQLTFKARRAVFASQFRSIQRASSCVMTVHSALSSGSRAVRPVARACLSACAAACPDELFSRASSSTLAVFASLFGNPVAAPPLGLMSYLHLLYLHHTAARRRLITSNSGIIDAPSAQLPVWNIYVSLAPLQLAGPITVGALFSTSNFTLHPPSPDAIGTRRMRFHLPPSTDWLMHGCAAGPACSLPKRHGQRTCFQMRARSAEGRCAQTTCLY